MVFNVENGPKLIEDGEDGFQRVQARIIETQLMVKGPHRDTGRSCIVSKWRV